MTFLFVDRNAAEVVGVRFSLSGASRGAAQSAAPRASQSPIKRRLSAIAILLLSVLVAGCGAARPAKYYELTVPTENANDAPDNVFPVTILIGPIMSSHLYREDHIVYGSNAESMGIYEYQRWAEPPTEMIQDVLLRALRSSGRYRAVYARRSSFAGDYVLRGHLYDFKEMEGSPMSARVTLELALRDTKTGNNVWTHLYNHDEPVSGKTVSAMVAALNRNVQRATNEFLTSMAQHFSANPPTPAPVAQ
jgi:cholesterol transport system auxiliary component